MDQEFKDFENIDATPQKYTCSNKNSPPDQNKPI